MVINHDKDDQQRRWPMKKSLYLALAVLGGVVLLCNEKPADNDQLRARLAQHIGVWEGVYRQTRSLQIIEDGVWTQTIAIDERRVE